MNLVDEGVSSNLSAVDVRPSINLEVHPWMSCANPGSPPTGWIRSEDLTPKSDGQPFCASGDFWPFDPQKPLDFQPGITVGNYVRVVGALITDSPHVETDPTITILMSPPCGPQVRHQVTSMERRSPRASSMR